MSALAGFWTPTDSGYSAGAASRDFRMNGSVDSQNAASRAMVRRDWSGPFAVTGTHKALLFGSSVEAAVIFGTITAIVGGILRDVLLARVPTVFQKKIYTLAAIIGALIQVSLESLGMEADWIAWLAMLSCVTLRLVSTQYHWHFPTFFGDRQ